jgi:hypothetical protein
VIVVIDDFVKDEDLLKEIASDKEFFNAAGENYFFWEGWWSSPPDTIKKRLIKYVWGDNCPINMTFNVAGFEYWTGIQSAEDDNPFLDNLGLHYDKDEILFQETGNLQTPIIGSVYYPDQNEFTGGMLEIFTKGHDKDPERIYAAPNRLIIFDAGSVAHSVSKVTSGTRKAIAINLWGEEPYSYKIEKLKKE